MPQGVEGVAACAESDSTFNDSHAVHGGLGEGCDSLTLTTERPGGPGRSSLGSVWPNGSAWTADTYHLAWHCVRAASTSNGQTGLSLGAYFRSDIWAPDCDC